MSDVKSLSDPLLMAEWFAIGWSREVTPGKIVSRRAMGRDLVLWRSSAESSETQGELHCWLDLCIHRGAKLSLGTIDHEGCGDSRECLVCPYHGWRYAASGQCVRIPSQPGITPPLKARTESFQVRERYGMIWVCFGEPEGDLPEFGIAEDPDFRVMLAGPYRFRALGPRLIENFLDVAHLSTVHAGRLGDPEQSEIESYQVGMGAHGPEAPAIHVWQPDPDGTGTGAYMSYCYEVQGPLTAGLVKQFEDKRFGILGQTVPIDEEFSEMRMVMAMNYGHEIPEEELIAFQDNILNQDRAIVESQRPELLPLDLQAELHLRSDRLAIAYRKWLREIGFTYGVV